MGFKFTSRKPKTKIKDFGTNVPSATDRDGLSLAQQRVGAGVLLLNGTAISGGTFTCPFSGGRLVTIYSAGDLSARTFTVTGTDKDGVAITNDIAGPNNTTTTGTKYFHTISSISSNGTVGSNVEAGFSSSLVQLHLSEGDMFKLDPTNAETVAITIDGAGPVAAYGMPECSLKIDVPASLTLTWADGTTPTDTRIYFAGGTEPTLTASGIDWFEFVHDGTTASGDTVWYGFTAGQDLKA